MTIKNMLLGTLVIASGFWGYFANAHSQWVLGALYGASPEVRESFERFYNGLAVHEKNDYTESRLVGVIMYLDATHTPEYKELQKWDDEWLQANKKEITLNNLCETFDLEDRFIANDCKEAERLRKKLEVMRKSGKRDELLKKAQTTSKYEHWQYHWGKK